MSVLPQEDFVKRLAGGHVEVHTLVGEGQDPHVYAISPKQMIALGKAACLFTVGMPFEKPLVAKIVDNDSEIRVIDTTAAIAKLAGVPHGHDAHEEHEDEDEDEDGAHDAHAEEDDHHADEQDPHVWTAPLQIKKQARAIAEGLEAIDPDHAVDYRAALAAFEGELDALHRDLGETLGPYRGKRFYVFHPGFAYFAAEFGLEQVAVQIGGQTPTPRELAAFIRQAKEDGVKVLFVQPQFDPRAAKRIADEVGAEVVIMDPLAADVLGNLRAAAAAIAKAFGSGAP